MKIVNLTLLCLCFLLAMSTANAQKASKLEKKAEAKIETLNQKLIKVNPKLALSDDQTKAAFDIFFEAQKSMKKVNKEVSDATEKKEALKTIRKEMNISIRKKVLNKEQKKALQKGDKKDKN